MSAPALVGNEREYVLECIETNWLSWNGRFVGEFEAEFSRIHDGMHAIASANGTVALHLVLAALGINEGDEVIVPSFTYVATANAVSYTGAKPKFVDCDPVTGNVTAELIAAAIGPRTRAVIAADLYGIPCDVEAIRAVCAPQGIHVIQDAAESLGSTVRGRLAGTCADAATFSFFANKTLTTGEGGMVITRSSELADKCRHLRGHAMDPERRWWFTDVGFNYRMSNLHAAVGLAQIERMGWHLAQRQRVAEAYTSQLRDHVASDVLRLPEVPPETESSWWLYTVRLGEKAGISRSELIAGLRDDGIETRETFLPMHVLPIYRRSTIDLPHAEEWGRTGLSLPTHANLTDDDIDYVVDRLLSRLR